MTWLGYRKDNCLTVIFLQNAIFRTRCSLFSQNIEKIVFDLFVRFKNPRRIHAAQTMAKCKQKGDGMWLAGVVAFEAEDETHRSGRKSLYLSARECDASNCPGFRLKPTLGLELEPLAFVQPMDVDEGPHEQVVALDASEGRWRGTQEKLLIAVARNTPK